MLCLAGCTQVVDSVVDTRYGQYNRATDWAKNEAILLNIVRASEYQPLNFMSFQPYTGSATVSGMASAPGFFLGPARAASQKQFAISNATLNASASGTGTISVTMLDTQDFYNALLSPVDYADLNAFQRQGYPRELLFRLFADYVSLKVGRFAFIVYNDPSDDKRCFDIPLKIVHMLYREPEDFQRKVCFDDLVEFALLSGLSSEVRTVADPPASDAKSSNQKKSSGGDASKENKQKSTTVEGRLCFDPALANRAYDEFEKYNKWRYIKDREALRMAQYHPICGGTGPQDIWPQTPKSQGPIAAGSKFGARPVAGTTSAPGVEKFTFSVGKMTGNPVWDIHHLGDVSIELGTRSTFSIYSFLGRLLNDPLQQANKLIGPLEADGNNDSQVLTVYKGGPVGCFASAVFDLSVYCVPIDGAANTKRAFSILSQLLALKTTTGDLQLTPTLRLLPQ